MSWSWSLNAEHSRCIALQKHVHISTLIGEWWWIPCMISNWLDRSSSCRFSHSGRARWFSYCEVCLLFMSFNRIWRLKLFAVDRDHSRQLRINSDELQAKKDRLVELQTTCRMTQYVYRVCSDGGESIAAATELDWCD